MDLAHFPRIKLAHLPTALEYLPRLTDHLGGPRIFLKRDDCTGLASGGNKTRKLEFLLADARENGADTVLTAGAVQSNHARQTAAAAATLGMTCELLLESRVASHDENYQRSGNALLDELFAARVTHYAGGTDMAEALETMAAAVRARGSLPYIIPVGGSNPIGALGYVDCALELLHQAQEAQLHIDCVVHATSSAGTQAGLVTGLRASHSAIPVLGMSVDASRSCMEGKVYELATEVAELIEAGGCVQRQDIVVHDDYIGEGYGVCTESMREALQLMAQLEGVLVDPVYSGKALAGLIDLVRRGQLKAGQNVVFLHTGGSAALFAYRDALGQPAMIAPGS